MGALLRVAASATLLVGLGAAAEVGPVAPVRLIYFDSKKSGGLITIDPDEAYKLSNTEQKTWRRADGSTWAYPRPAPGLVPIYRYVRPETNDHLFTLDANEGSLAGKYLGYRPEGVCCYVFSSRDTAKTYVGRDDRPDVPLPGQTMAIVRQLLKNHQHVYRMSGDPWTISSDKNLKMEGTLGWMIIKETPPNPVPTR